MKTIKLKMVKGEIDTSAFNQNKFPNREDVIRKIAQKLKKSISQIRKNKSIVDVVYNKQLNQYFDTKIVKDNHWLIERLLTEKWTSIMDDINDNQEFNGWQQKTKYNPKTKTFNVNLCYKNRLAYELNSNLQSIRINEDFKKGKRMLPNGEYESFPKSKFIKWYGQKLWDWRIEETKKLKKDLLQGCPKFVKAWISTEGKNEIEFIEKTLEELGNVKIEVYNGKNKKLDTFYVQYKRTGLTFDIPNNLKKQFKLN